MKNEHHFEEKYFLELESYMYALKLLEKFVSKRTGKKTTPNSKKRSKITPSSDDVPENALLLLYF